MDWQFFKELLEKDSTSGREREVAEWLSERLLAGCPGAPRLECQEVGDGTLNLFLQWGTPRVVFCSHMDTVPPYIPPTFPEEILSGGTPFASLTPAQGHGLRSAERYECSVEPIVVKGRGSCDAKGQVFALYTACCKLASEGFSDFGLLLLAGEETGSWGAKAFAKTPFRAPYLIIGEPTENRMVSAGKGTKSYCLKFTGEPFHSGYPQYGVSAVDLFNQFYNELKAKDFGLDPELGETTWNIGLLHSDNAQNILSPELTCRLYFRTTFVSHQAVQDWMQAKDGGRLTVTPNGIGDTPAHYLTLDGFPSGPVAFGSDAPHLTNFTHRAICGPGSIRHAHRSDEHVLVQDLETAVDQYVRMYHALTVEAKCL